MLSPIDIHNKEFNRSFRGYNEDEIDDFLDQVVNDYEKLFRENKLLKDEIATTQKENEGYKRQEKTLQDTLLVAQKTADEVMAAARKNAEELKANTTQECANMKHQAEMDAQQKLADAEAHANKTMADANAEAKKMLEAAAIKVRALVDEYDHLVRSKKEIITRVRATFETELAILNDAYDVIPDPAEKSATAERLVNEIDVLEVPSIMKQENVPQVQAQHPKAENFVFNPAEANDTAVKLEVPQEDKN